MQLRSYRTRFTPGQLRRRAARVRRREETRAHRRPAPLRVARPVAAWNEAHIQQRIAKLTRFLRPAYGWRYIRNQVNGLREHLIAVANAARIERCTYQREVRNARDETIWTGAECGGRIRQRRVVRGGNVERFCDTCGRVAIA
jgi:hypothetical protein